MSEHSPEPWKIDTASADRRVHVSGIYDAQQETPLTPSPGDWTMSVEDARRIVACVNACRGIPTEILERVLGQGAMSHHEPEDEQEDETLGVYWILRP